MEESEKLLVEYKELSSGFRFISTIRLGVLTFIAGFVGWMANFLFQVYKEKYTPLRVVIPLSGLVGVFLIAYLEVRVVRLYDLLLKRGVDVEGILGITSGTYQRIYDLTAGPRLRRVTETAIALLIVLFVVMVVIEIIPILTIRGTSDVIGK